LRPANKPLESKGVVLGVVSMPVNQTNSIQSNQNDVEVTEEKETELHSNPVLNLNIMQLTKENFANCRTQDGYICISDAIASFRGCSIKTATDTFNDFHQSGRIRLDENDIKKIKFPRSNGRMGNAVPCCTFQTLLKILPNVPGKEAKILRDEMSELSSRSTGGCEVLQEAIGVRRATLSSEGKEILLGKRADNDALDIDERARLKKARIMRWEKEAIKSQIDIFAMCKDLIGSDGDDRDQILLDDMKRNIVVNVNRNIHNVGPTIEDDAPKEDYGLPISELITEYLGKPLRSKKGTIGATLLQSIGKSAAKYYRTNFNKEPPVRKQHVDGATRNVKHYREKDRHWLSKIVKDTCNQAGLVSR